MGATSLSYVSLTSLLSRPPLCKVRSVLTYHRAMASVPISGELAEKYGYLSLSIYSGVSLLVGGLLLVLARLAQSRRLLDAI